MAVADKLRQSRLGRGTGRTKSPIKTPGGSGQARKPTGRKPRKR